MAGGAASVLATNRSQQQSPTIPGTASLMEWIVEICYTHVLEDYATVLTHARSREEAIREAERHVLIERSSEDSPAASLTITRRYAEPRRPNKRMLVHD